MKARSLFDPSVDAGIDFTVLNAKGEFVPEVSMTKQSDKDSCDINKILDRYAKTGQLPDMIKAEPRYGDFSSAPQFQEALDVVLKAQEQFDALDASVRDRFHHDPARMLEFCSDPKNSDELVKLGLAVVRPLPPKADVPPAVEASKKPGADPGKASA